MAAFKSFEEIEAWRVALYRMIFGHIAPSLPVQPDGRVVGCLTGTGTEKYLFHATFPVYPG